MRIRRLIAVGAISLSACAAYELQLSSTSQEVAVVNVDNPFVFTSTNELHTFTVTVQSGSDDDRVTSVTPANALACQNFMINAPGLPARICGSSVMNFAPSGVALCPIVYKFDVTYVGMSNESCLVDIAWTSNIATGSGSGSGTATLMLSSMVAAPSMLVSPGSADFGQVPVTTTSNPPTRVTVTNNGAVALAFSGSLNDPGGAFNVVPVAPASLSPHTLNVGSAEKFDVTCTPAQVQLYGGSLDFTGTAGSDVIMKSTTLSCEGINSTITITPSQITFPSTLVGNPPVDQSVNISGPSNTTIQSITLDATAQADHVSIVSAPNPGTPLGTGGVTVTLHYAADAKHDAGPLGKLSVKVSSDAMARDVGISGEALPGSVGTNPAAAELGPVCAGGSASMPVEVYANAAGDVSFESVGTPTGGFTVMPDAPLPKLLRGNHVGTSAMLTVATQPTMIGDQTGAVALHTNIPAPNTDYMLALHATVLPAGTGTTPDRVHFGSVDLDTTTSGRDVTLTNCTTSDLAIHGAKIAGKDTGEFSVVKGDMMATLKPTESAVFTVIMSAHSNGEKSATLAIDTDGGTISVPLDGTVGGSTPRETYYACAVGGSTAAAVPIGLALLALRRRRR